MVSKSLLSLAVGAASIASTMAASSTITTSLIVPGTMPATITASVVDNKHGMTTWALDCGDAPCIASPAKTLTITENPSTLIFTSVFSTSDDSFSESYTVTIGCDINSKKSHVVCTDTYDLHDVVSGRTTVATTTTATTSGPALKSTNYSPIVVTAGADKLGDKGAAAPAPTQKALLAGVAAVVGGAALIL